MSVVDLSPPAARSTRELVQANVDPRAVVATLVPVLVLAIELGYYFYRSPASFARIYLLGDLSTAMPLILVATGQAIVIIGGGIDISVGGTISLVSALAARTFTASTPGVTAWSVALVGLGFAIGATNGFLIGRLQLSPVIVTIAMWSITGGLAIVVLSAPGGNISLSDVNFWTGTLVHIPSPLLIIGCLCIGWFILRRRPFGQKLYAIGSDREAAIASGVRVGHVEWAAYSLCGGLAAIAGLYVVASQASGDPNAGTPLILDSIAAVVVGGIPITGGRGSIINVIVGALIYAAVGYIITVSYVSPFLAPFFTGVILIAVVAISSLVSIAASRRLRST